MIVLTERLSKKITCLFLIISLGIGQLLAMEEVSVEEHEGRIKEEAKLLFEPSFFQRHVIDLPSLNSKQLPLAFDQLTGMCIVNYNLNCKLIGQLIQTNGGIWFKSHDPQNYDFLLQTPLKIGNLAIDVLGRFVFQKPIDSEIASVSSKSVEFRNKFSSSKTISLDVDYGDNYGDIACADFSFKGNRFKCKTKSKLTAQGSLAVLAKQGFSNVGQILCTNKAFISTPSFENWGAFNAGNLVFENGNILNKGSILVNGSFTGLCKNFDHQGKLKVGTDCIFEKVNNLTTSELSSWCVGNDWKVTIATLYLAGNIQVGNLSLFKVNSDATIAGPFSASIIHIDSDNLITCDLLAKLTAGHHIGLKAKGWLEYQGDVFKTFVHEPKKSQELEKENPLFKIFPCGVFLHSAQNGIKKSGNIVSRSGTVALDAKKGLTHSGITDAGFAQGAMILMNSASIDIEKESIIKSLNARLQAQNSIEQHGNAQIKEKLVMQASQIKLGGSMQVGDLNAQANTIKTTAESHVEATGNTSLAAKESIEIAGSLTSSNQLAMQAQNISLAATSRVEATGNTSLAAKESIEIAGALTSSNQLAMQAQNISLQNTARVQAQNASIQADEKVVNHGFLKAIDNLFMRAKYLENANEIEAKNAYFKADRWWWNKWGGKVRAEEQLRIDALLSANTGGLLKARNLSINSAIDLNVLGIYHAKKMNINSLIALHAGLLIPRFDSADDVFTTDNGLIVANQLLRFIPYGHLVRLGFGICKGAYGLYHQVPVLIKDAKDVYNLENAGVSDWMPIICGTKNLAMSAYQTGSMTYGAGQMAYNKWYPSESSSTESSPTQIPQDQQSEPNHDKHMDTFLQELRANAPSIELTQNDQSFELKFEKQTDKSFDWQAVADQVPTFASHAASNIASMLGAQMNRDTLVDVNAGVMLGVNGSSQSVWNANAGIAAFANSYSVNTSYGTNCGVLAAVDLSVQASRRYDTAGMIAANKMFVQAEDLNIGGNVVNMSNATFKAEDTLNLNASIHGANVDTHAQKTILGEQSNIKARGTVNIETHSLTGDKSNAIEAANHTHLKAKELENKGSTHGKSTVEFTGNANQLKSIGNVEHLQYRGTVADGLADRLVHGNNNVVNISESGSVAVHAGNEDVHFKDAHDTKHSVSVASHKNITIDDTLKSGGSLGLSAGKDINHKSMEAADSIQMDAKGNIISHSDVKRTVDRANYEDKLDRVTVQAGNAVNISAGHTIDHAALSIESGKGGTHMQADGKIISREKTIEKHTEYSKTDSKGNVVKSGNDTVKKAAVSEYKSKGDIEIHAGDTCEFFGTTFDTNRSKLIHGKNGVHGHAVYDTHHHESHRQKDGGWFGTSKASHKESVSQTAKGIDFKGKSTPEISSEREISMAFTSDSEKVVLNAPQLEIKTAKSESASVSHRASENIVWESEKSEQKQRETFVPSFPGTIETNAQNIHLDAVEGRAPVNIDMKNTGAHLTQEMFKEIHNHQKLSAQGPTRAAAMVIALAVTMATSGAGSALGAGVAASIGCKSAVATMAITNMTSAAVTSFATQATDALLRCNGEPLAAAKKIASIDAFKKFVLSTATAGAIAGANSAIAEVVPAISEGTHIGQKLAYAAPRQAAAAGIRTVADVAAGQNLKEAALENMRSAAAGTLGAACASEIGQAYHEGNIDPITHKVLHAGVGAISGAIVGGKSGAVAGATGALVAETIADAFAPKKPTLERMLALETKLGRQLTQEEFLYHWNTQTQNYMQRVATHADISKLTAASVALLARQDVAIAQATGANAVDNNFMGLIVVGVVVGSVAYSAYNVYSAYHEGGPTAALQQLGIEVVTEAVGIATGAVAGKVVGKIGYKFGPKIYPVIEGALEAAFKAQPGLKIALGKFSNTLIAGAEKIGNSAVGKGIKKADEWALKQAAKITHGLENGLSGLGEDLAAAHVPGSVAAKMEARAAEQAVKAEAQAIAKEVADLRRAIVNREIEVSDNLLPKFGFSGTRTKRLTDANKTTGRFGVNTELDGDINDAYKVYTSKVKEFSTTRRLIKEEVKEEKGVLRMCSKFDDDSIVQVRTNGKSGHPKVDITDTDRNIEEKITFK